MPTENIAKSIRARDLRGEELTLSVVERADLICIQTNGDAIIMSPASVVALLMELLHALGGRLVPTAPLSGRL
jgi:hypothetical protein